MRIISTLLLVACPFVVFAQTYSTKSQGSNNSAGGAYVAPIITRTFTMPAYAPPISSPGKTYTGNSYSARNVTSDPAPTSSSLATLYMPRQKAADKANNYKCISGDCVNGIGTWQNTPEFWNYRYVGGWKNGLRDGNGKYYDWEGYLTYDGMFSSGKRSGYGRHVIYKQEYISDKEDPILPYNISLKSTYEGMFLEDVYEGNGILNQYDKRQDIESSYEGNFKKGEKDGKGTLVTYTAFGGNVNGYYVGNWQNDKRIGYGIDSGYNGLYVGNFSKDFRDGEGVSFWPKDVTKINEPVASHVGFWKTGYKDGEGADYDYAGNILYEGNYKKDNRHGKGKMYKTDGSFTTGDWVDGVLQGFGTDFSKEGKIVYTGNFLNGLRNGEGIFYKADGTSIKGTWVNGTCKEIGDEAGTGKKSLSEINENFKKGNINEWEIDALTPAKIEFKKGVLLVTVTAKSLEQSKISVPGYLLFEDNDDWTFEATARMVGKKYEEWGIGWDGGDIMLSSSFERCSIGYFYNNKSKYASNSGDTKNKLTTKWNTVRIEKKGNTIAAFLNGENIYSGVTGKMNTKALYLIISSGEGNIVEFNEVNFKKL